MHFSTSRKLENDAKMLWKWCKNGQMLGKFHEILFLENFSLFSQKFMLHEYFRESFCLHKTYLPKIVKKLNQTHFSPKMIVFTKNFTKIFVVSKFFTKIFVFLNIFVSIFVFATIFACIFIFANIFASTFAFAKIFASISAKTYVIFVTFCKLFLWKAKEIFAERGVGGDEKWKRHSD
jgi:hypothetical protein